MQQTSSLDKLAFSREMKEDGQISDDKLITVVQGDLKEVYKMQQACITCVPN